MCRIDDIKNWEGAKRLASAQISSLKTDKDFCSAIKLLMKFDSINILGVNSSENHHSNFLAWLLSPKSLHGLNDKFLKIFLECVFSLNQCDSDTKAILDKDLKDLRIIREWRKKDSTKRIDIVGVSDEHEWLFYIENKLYHEQGKDQLKEYLDLINETYQDYEKIPIFLTMNYATPNHDDYNIYSYYEIVNNLDELKQNSGLPKEIEEFITLYIDNINLLIDPINSTWLLCKRIYENYKSAFDGYSPLIDLDINEYSTFKKITLINDAVPNINFRKAIDKFKDQYKDISLIEENLDSKYFFFNKEYWFLDNSASDKIKELQEDNYPKNILNGNAQQKFPKWRSKYPFSFRFKIISNELVLELLCGPLDLIKEYYPSVDINELKYILDKNNESAEDCEQNKLTLEKMEDDDGSKYFIINKRSEGIQDWSDSAEIYSKVDVLYRATDKLRDDIKQVINELNDDKS